MEDARNRGVHLDPSPALGLAVLHRGRDARVQDEHDPRVGLARAQRRMVGGDVGLSLVPDVLLTLPVQVAALESDLPRGVPLPADGRHRAVRLREGAQGVGNRNRKVPHV